MTALTAPISHLQAMQIYHQVAKILELGDPAQLSTLQAALDALTLANLTSNNNKEMTDLLPIEAMAKAIGTTTKNLKQHLAKIKEVLRKQGLRGHENPPNRKILTGRPGRRRDGFTQDEVQAVARQIKDLGTLTLAFPIRK